MSSKPRFVGEKVPFADAFTEVSRGTKKFKQSEYAEIGAHPIVDQGKEAIAGYSDEENGLFTDVPAIVFGDHTRCVKYVEEPFFAGADGVKILKPKLPGSTRFWWHALRATPIEDLGYSRHFKLLKAAKFKVINETRQEEVVACLDGVLEQISYAEDQLTGFDSLVKSRFVEMFGDPVDDKIWPYVTLAELCTKLGSGATPRGGKSAYKTEGIPLIRSMNVHNGRFVWKDLAYIDDDQAAKLNGVTLMKGDVLLNITGASVARSCILPDELAGGRVNQHVSIVRVDQTKMLPVILNAALISDSYQRFLLNDSRMAGATREAITKEDLKNMMVPLPPLSLQQQFANFAVRVDKSRFIAQQQIEKLQMLYDSLAQDYFGD